MDEWLFTDEQALDELNSTRLVGEGDEPAPPPLDSPIAVRLHDLLVHDNKRWFDFLGGADIRVDVLVVQGNVLGGDPTSFYTPTTMHFPGVRDESTLPLDEHGLIAYVGWPKYFIDISVLVSRDTSKADDLATLLQKEAQSPGFTDGLGALVQLAYGAGDLAVKNAIAVAATLGNLAYRVLRTVTGNTIGVYRGNRLAYPSQFGLGRNPETGAYRCQDLSLWFDVVKDGPDGSSTSS